MGISLGGGLVWIAGISAIAVEVEVFGLEYSAALERIMFRGVRFNDGKYVLGAIDLPTGVTSMQPTSKMRQLLAFDD